MSRMVHIVVAACFDIEQREIHFPYIFVLHHSFDDVLYCASKNMRTRCVILTGLSSPMSCTRDVPFSPLCRRRQVWI